MNAARFARELIQDGVDAKLAHSLAEHLAEELERTVATREHVELVVTREVQQLRVEMQGLRTEMQGQVEGLRTEMQGLRAEMHQEMRRLTEHMDEKFTTQFRWMLTWMAVVTAGILVALLR